MNRAGSALMFLVLVPALPLGAQDQPYLHPLFTSDMVLQRDAKVPVWGWTTPGAQVAVAFAGGAANATADSGGRWRVELGPFPASGPHTMQITGPENLSLTNVMVGDVWLCMGQSNMERDMTDASLLNAAAERADSANFPNIRHFKVQSDAAQGAVARVPQAVLPAGSGPWRVAVPTTSGGFSAVGYFMARALNQHTGVAMGILNASKGTSRHAPWMSREAASSIEDFADELFNLDSVVINDLQTVSVRHNAMVAPLVGFPVRGIVWYQGESSTSVADQYHDALPAMLADWRAKFGADLPIVVVQLSTYANASTLPVRVFDTWPVIREAQFNCALSDPATALVCTLDAGDAASPADIHPKNKQDVGRRVARAMRALAYGESIEGEGPMFSHAVIEGAAIRCYFSKVGEGLMMGVKAPNDLTPVAEAPAGTELFGFAVTAKANASAEADWKAATATIDSETGSVLVSSAEVPNPVHVRYAWATNPNNFADGRACNLYSKITDGAGNVIDGLPASPFRSDPKAWIKVNNGTGSTTVTAPRVPGSTVAISAAAAPSGQEFVGWAGDTSALADPSATTTTALVNAGYTSIGAVYRFSSAPIGLAAGLYGGEAALSWTPALGARYSIYRADDGGPWVAIASGIAGPMFTDQEIMPGRSYSYSITADLPGSSSPPAPAVEAKIFSLDPLRLSGGVATVSFPSVVGRLYRVEKSSDLKGWQVLQDSLVGSGAQIQVTDTNALPANFYRAVAR